MDIRNPDMDSLITSRCRYVRITDMMLLEFTLATVTSCTIVLLHISGRATIIFMDTGYEYFLRMLIDIYTMVLHTIAIMTSGIVHTVDITWSADLLSEQCSQRISLQT